MSFLSVTWHKGARDLQYGTRHRIRMLGNMHNCRVASVLCTDYGEYTARAVNVHGVTESVCIVKVNKKGPRLDDE